MRNKKTSFDRVIELLVEYKRDHGNLCVPKKYVTVNGVKLGSIVHTIRKGDRKTTVEEKAKLNELGFVWKYHDVLSFNEILELFKAYKEEHGDLLVPKKYVTVNGVKLGSIVHTIRKGDRKTTVEEKAKLNELGFVWKCHDVLSFDEVLELFKEYKEEHGNLLVPFNYVTADGIYLGRIVDSIRTGNRKTTAEEKNILNELGFVWKCHDVLSFDEVLERLKDYKEEYGNLLVPKKYVTTDGTKLGGIVQRIRRGKRKTTVEEKAKLDELGFVWKVR